MDNKIADKNNKTNNNDSNKVAFSTNVFENSKTVDSKMLELSKYSFSNIYTPLSSAESTDIIDSINNTIDITPTFKSPTTTTTNSSTTTTFSSTASSLNSPTINVDYAIYDIIDEIDNKTNKTAVNNGDGSTVSNQYNIEITNMKEVINEKDALIEKLRSKVKEEEDKLEKMTLGELHLSEFWFNNYC